MPLVVVVAAAAVFVVVVGFVVVAAATVFVVAVVIAVVVVVVVQTHYQVVDCTISLFNCAVASQFPANFSRFSFTPQNVRLGRFRRTIVRSYAGKRPSLSTGKYRLSR